MRKINFEKKRYNETEDYRYVFDAEKLGELGFDKISVDKIDSKFIKKYFQSENYIVDEINSKIILYDRCTSKYNINWNTHRGFSGNKSF